MLRNAMIAALLLILPSVLSCDRAGRSPGADFGLTSPAGAVCTSESGARMAKVDDIVFSRGRAEGLRVVVMPGRPRQAVDGIGSSITESSAFVLAHLSSRKRRELMERLWGAGDGCAGFSFTRTHIGSCDFSVEGRYSYRDSEDSGFSIAPDRAGFRNAGAWPDVRERGYDLLPMIKEALGIEPGLKVIASAWTAPPWMKDTGDWFTRGYSGGDGVWHDGTGGRLLKKYYPAYARYIRDYIDACSAEGVPIWAVTPVNEPNGNGGNWESMHWEPEAQAEFIRDYLGPALDGTDTRILAYDQNRGEDLERWADAIYADGGAGAAVYGMAVHWYSSTVDSRTESLDYTHAKAPEKTIIHTEGCIDNLGLQAPGGIADPEGYEESGWWMNDAFWWNDSATDWGYTAEWGDWLDPADHPKYTPVHRYARDIIETMNHHVSGWVDWNAVLDSRGGPNHVGNFCGAPIMIDIAADDPDDAVYYTPVFYVLAQMSRSIRPGDRVVESRVAWEEGPGHEGLFALATLSGDSVLSIQLLNTAREPLALGLQVGVHSAGLTIDANSLLTIRAKLGGKEQR